MRVRQLSACAGELADCPVSGGEPSHERRSGAAPVARRVARRPGGRARRAPRGLAAQGRGPRVALLLTSHPPILVLLINLLSIPISSRCECYLGMTNMTAGGRHAGGLRSCDLGRI
jgi:hypothetical protein